MAAPASSTRSPVLRRILLIQLFNMGDVVLATPAIRAARRWFPGARIAFLTGAAGADALAGNLHLSEIIEWPGRGAGANLALARTLRRGRWDAVVDLHSRPRTAMLALATAAPIRIGIRGRGPRNMAYTRLVPRETGAVYMARQKLALLAPLGVPAGGEQDLRLEITVGAAERAWADRTWQALGLADAEPVVAISPVARHAFKQWGAERWAEVADRVAGAGYRVLLTSGPGESEQAASVAGRMRQPAVWDHGPTTVRRLAALYQRCVAWLGNDGGPKHVAAAAGVPTVTVSRWKFSPVWTDSSPGSPHVSIDRPPPQGCDRRCARCVHLGCLGAVTPGTVADAAIEVLARAAAGAGVQP